MSYSDPYFLNRSTQYLSRRPHQHQGVVIHQNCPIVIEASNFTEVKQNQS